MQIFQINKVIIETRIVCGVASKTFLPSGFVARFVTENYLSIFLIKNIIETWIEFNGQYNILVNVLKGWWNLLN